MHRTHAYTSTECLANTHPKIHARQQIHMYTFAFTHVRIHAFHNLQSQQYDDQRKKHEQTKTNKYQHMHTRFDCPLRHMKIAAPFREFMCMYVRACMCARSFELDGAFNGCTGACELRRQFKCHRYLQNAPTHLQYQRREGLRSSKDSASCQIYQLHATKHTGRVIEPAQCNVWKEQRIHWSMYRRDKTKPWMDKQTQRQAGRQANNKYTEEITDRQA